MKKLAIVPLCLTLALGSEALYGQQQYPTSEITAWFERGKSMFERHNYVGCADQLTQFQRYNHDETLQQEAAYMIAAAAYERGMESAPSELRAFIEQYPWSGHAVDAHFMLANSYFFQADYTKACEAYSEIAIEGLPESDQPAYLYRMGLSTLKCGKLEEARPYFVALTNADTPYQVAAQYYVAYIAYCNNAYSEAEPTLVKLAESAEFGTDASQILTQIYFVDKRYPEAIALAEKLLTDHPTAVNSGELYRILGESYSHTKNSTKAVEYLSCYKSEVEFPSRNALYLLGVELYRLENYKEVVKNLSKVVGKDDAMTQNSYLYLAQSYLKLMNKQGARLAFEQAASYDHDTQVQETALYNYALAIHETAYSPFDESVRVFERFLNLFPQSRYADTVNDHLVEVYLTTRNYRTALASIEKIKQPTAKILSAKQRLLFQLGTEHYINNELDRAAELFNQSIALGNYDADAKALAYFWRGECAYRNGDYSRAASDYQTYLSTTPNRGSDTYALAHYNKGYAHFKQHQFGTAQQLFRRYLPLGKDKVMLADACNRIGDSYYSGRNFSAAQEWYSQAVKYQPSAGDYALYQEGFMQGLQGKTSEKVRTLKQVIARYPQSEYIDDALFEIGLAQVQLKNYPEAIDAFESIMIRFPQGAIAHKAGLQLGVVYFNDNQIDQSIAAYKQVINNFPGSPEARIAAEDLKAVYLEKNDIATYAAYIESLDGSITFNASEQDSLTYLAAERTFMKGDKEQAVGSFLSYLQNFPKGAFTTPAQYYLGAYYYEVKQYDKALSRLEQVLQYPDSPFGQEALLRVAEIHKGNKAYDKALSSYEMLALKASQGEKLRQARVGVLEMNVALQRDQEVILAANKLLEDSKLSPQWIEKARYARAHALMNEGEVERAMEDYLALSKEPRTAYGAEATYRWAQNSFERNHSAAAEEAINAFIASGTPHQYWLARGFILLADINLKKGDPFQAKQLLLSLQSNYNGSDDDIATMIESRLEEVANNEPKQQ